MAHQVEKVRPGMYVRHDTPQDMRVTSKFVKDISRGDTPPSFKKAVREFARQENRAAATR
ncbi:MAG: hypothetical protein ACYC4L_04570 [Chloroflexota bacterium]